MTTIIICSYLVIGLIFARLVVSGQSEESAQGMPALAATLVLILLWPVAIAGAAAMAVLSVLMRRRDKD